MIAPSAVRMDSGENARALPEIRMDADIGAIWPAPRVHVGSIGSIEFAGVGDGCKPKSSIAHIVDH